MNLKLYCCHVLILCTASELFYVWTLCHSNQMLRDMCWLKHTLHAFPSQTDKIISIVREAYQYRYLKFSIL